jgi:hypothetical protein
MVQHTLRQEIEISYERSKGLVLELLNEILAKDEKSRS